MTPGLSTEERTRERLPSDPNDPNYYAGFLRDPDGNKIEIVTFAGE
jgi:hypothetical protein